MFKIRRRSGVFIGNFKHISHLVLVFLVLTLNMQLPTGYNFRDSNKLVTLNFYHPLLINFIKGISNDHQNKNVRNRLNKLLHLYFDVVHRKFYCRLFRGCIQEPF